MPALPADAAGGTLPARLNVRAPIVRVVPPAVPAHRDQRESRRRRVSRVRRATSPERHARGARRRPADGQVRTLHAAADAGDTPGRALVSRARLRVSGGGREWEEVGVGRGTGGAGEGDG